MEDIIEDLMREYKLPRYAMDAILNAPYRFMYKRMREQKFDSFIIYHLGKFVVTPGWKKWGEENYKDLREKKRLLRELKYKKDGDIKEST